MAYIIYSDGTKQKSVPLANYPVFKIGRTSNNDMTIVDDMLVSREHCVIFFDSSLNKFILKDNDSRNGTYLNEQKISGIQVELKTGDKIRIGDTEIIFSETDLAYSETTTTRGISKIGISHRRKTDDNLDEELVQTTSFAKYPEANREKNNLKKLQTSDTIAPGTEINGYQIVRVIGNGQFSTVYLAFQESVGRTVALKVFNNNYISHDAPASFIKQMHTIGRFQHQNILPFFDGGTFNNLCYISMLYVQEGTLANKIINSFPLSESFILTTFTKIAQALKYALDEYGIIHLDINPKSILYTDSNEPVISDLGLSAWLAWSYQLNRKNFMANPSYMPPEQALDQSLDWKADQYSLGIAIFEAFAGFPPFKADNAYNLINKHKNDPIVFPKRHNISRTIKNAIIKMTAKKPVDRFSSWEEVINAIKDNSTQPRLLSTPSQQIPMKKKEPLTLKSHASQSQKTTFNPSINRNQAPKKFILKK